MVKLAKVTSFHFGSPYSCIICNVQIRMHSFPCVDETGCICTGLYKGNLVFNKDLTLNVTLKKKKTTQFNSNAASIFVAGSK